MIQGMIVNVNGTTDEDGEPKQGLVVDRIYEWQEVSAATGKVRVPAVLLGVSLFDHPSPAVSYFNPEDLTVVEFIENGADLDDMDAGEVEEELDAEESEESEEEEIE